MVDAGVPETPAAVVVAGTAGAVAVRAAVAVEVAVGVAVVAVAVVVVEEAAVAVVTEQGGRLGPPHRACRAASTSATCSGGIPHGRSTPTTESKSQSTHCSPGPATIDQATTVRPSWVDIGTLPPPP